MTHMDDERVRAEHSPRTEAEQALEWLKGDRAAQLSAWHERALCVPRLANRLPAPADRTADFMAAALDEMAGRLFPIMRELEPGRAGGLRRIKLGSVQEPEAFATFSRFEDDSCLALVSDGLIGLLHLLCDLTCVWYEGTSGRGWRAAFRMARALEQLPQDNEFVPILAVALRWNLIHRRTWGNSASLPVEPSTTSSEDLRDILAQTAWIFVIAHECAHGLLGHGPADIGSWEAEHAADAIALRAVLRTLKIDEGAAMPIHGLVAVRIALIATRLVEDVLFIRPPTSHPSVEARWSALGEVVGSVEFVKPQVVVAGLDEAARRAANLREALPEAWWDTAYAHPQVHCDVHAPEYYKLVKLLDRTSFGDPNDPARVLKGRDDEHCDRALRAVFTARDSNLAAGLGVLGVAPTVAAPIVDRGLPLSAYSLMECVIDSPTLQALPMDKRRIPAVCVAALLGGIEKGIL